MTHAEFVAGCRAGTVDPRLDAPAAARHLNARLMLPLVRLPVLGTGVALALIGWIVTGLSVIALGILLPRLVALSAPQIILDEALASETRFAELVASGIINPH